MVPGSTRMSTGIYSIREGHNGLWAIWSGDLVISAGLRLGQAIKLARLLAREHREGHGIEPKVELVSCGHTIDVTPST
ncbi:hypothetical protein SAMN05216570_1463 [Dyella sp. OK004]|nr:hypothetical protein SAMN05216570_1463 [Dyella sp. OK004]